MSKVKFKKGLTFEGVVRIEDEKVFIEVEEYGDRPLSELLHLFDGELIKGSINMVEDVME